MKQEFARMFMDLDLLVAPSRLGAATKVGEPLDRRLTPMPAPAPSSLGMTSLIPAGNLVGLPAIGLPCGFADKLPVAIQIVGTPYSENVLVAVGKAFQERTDWHRQHPPVG
jgi:aspartyl-tRNA(Asn)/glutamyl-tRNA(Gln) amidotransferase subunit A